MPPTPPTVTATRRDVRVRLHLAPTRPSARIRVEGGEGLGQALILASAVVTTAGLVLAEHWWRTGELGLGALLARAAAVLAFFAAVAGIALVQAWAIRALQRHARTRRPWPVADVRTWQERSAQKDWNARALATAGGLALSLLALRACDDASTWHARSADTDAAAATVVADGSRR